jgi:mono/diheme cytochrome c family protein
MIMIDRRWLSFVVTPTLAALLIGAEPGSPTDLDAAALARQVRPILSDKCYTCHGPDEKTREAGLRLDAFEDAVNAKAIVPGDPGQSEVMRRILLAADDEQRMPPSDSHKTLSEQEIEIVRRWIELGAPYEQHWSHRPLVRPPVPPLDLPGIRSPIDAFILQAQVQRGLQPSPSAERATLVRRLYLDLLGVPPSFEEVQQCIDDPSADAIEKLVDRLLRDQRFGERMAIYWLDLVRYADTIGYHSDNHMEVSAYRDYVIDAFNANMPFDQFTIEQLAGDLLEQPSELQRIASGYNRLLQTTEEGGAQAKEYVAIYAADRVRNLSAVWLGQTIGCAQCHDHKYDPYTMRDFYSLAAFFADIDENAVGKRDPNLTLVTPQEQAKIDALNDTIARLQPERLMQSDPDLAARLKEGQAAWEQDTLEALDAQAPGDDTVSVPAAVLAALRVGAVERSEVQAQTIADHYRTLASELTEAKARQAEAQRQLDELKQSLRTMLVSKALDQPRLTRILPRGNWLDDSGEIVEPALPAFLPRTPIASQRANRLDLARWLVAAENPLTARTFMNRLWKLFFGSGLSRSLDDLGGQGEPPTHPELLDWLAAEFRDSGWDVKHMVRLITTSSTYAQSSLADPQRRAKDPDNRYYARQGRWRVEAEFVRDIALAISGLLADQQVGGKSVKPYQPDGYWQHLNFPVRTWQADSGEGLYRRSLYTFWCRTFLHPSMLAFDAPSREECTAERSRSNIPQQALVLLNDPIFVEAARALAARIVDSGETVSDRITWAIRTSLSRDPLAPEIELLGTLYQQQRERYDHAPEDAQALIRIGNAPPPPNVDAAELAAWTQVARAIINAYETTSRF